VTIRLLILLLLSANAQASTKPLKWGGKGWVLIIDGDDGLLDAIKQNWYLAWCFESVRGKMPLKKLELRLTLDEAGQARIGTDGLSPLPEDHDILLCLNSSWKAEPPQVRPGHYPLLFTFSKVRR
jgi:hypothetical protein